jgi:hypothetical protein
MHCLLNDVTREADIPSAARFPLYKRSERFDENSPARWDRRDKMHGLILAGLRAISLGSTPLNAPFADGGAFAIGPCIRSGYQLSIYLSACDRLLLLIPMLLPSSGRVHSRAQM